MKFPLPGFLSLFLSTPSLLPETRKMETLKVEPLCTMNCDSGLYFAGCEEKIAVREAVFWSTVQDELIKMIFPLSTRD